MCLVIIIIEGVDGTGKSTFARRLAEERGVELWHRGAPTAHNWLEEYVLPLTEGGKTKDVVIDRWHFGEMVWPQVMGRRSLFAGLEAFNQCNSILGALGAKMIYVKRDHRGIRKTLAARGESSQMGTVLRGETIYDKLVWKIDGLPVFHIKSDDLHRQPDYWANWFANWEAVARYA